jgi:hypothetical protein
MGGISIWRSLMLSRLTAAAVLVLAASAGPALACKGSTVILQDNFQTAEPDWHGTGSIANGHAVVTSTPFYDGQTFVSATFGGMFYGAKHIDSGDACVDMVGPQVADPTNAAAGIMFGFTDIDSFWVFFARQDGQAALYHFLPFDQNGGTQATLIPIAYQPSVALKHGGGVTNTLRVSWNGKSGATYINDQPFWPFAISRPLQNTFVGLYVGPGFPSTYSPQGSVPMSYQFSNLKITNVQ